MRDASHYPHAARVRPALTAVLAAAYLASPQLANAGNFTENFDFKPIDWKGLDNDAANWGPYGFSNTNNTGGASGAGEAGGTFLRTPVRNYYADTSLYGALNDKMFWGASGEVFVSAPNADNDVVLGHFKAPQQGATEEERHHAGILLRELDSGNWRFMARIRGDGPSQYDGDVHVVPNGNYQFNYNYNPSTRILTANLLPIGGGSPLFTSTVGPLDSGEAFIGDSFGWTGGFNGAGSGQNVQAFMDAVTYSTYMPKVNQNFNSNPSNWQVLGGPIQYGFSNTNNTGQESGSGEAGGVMVRDLFRRGYADTKIQALTQEQPFGASGEFFWGNPNNADNEVFIAHYAKDQVDGTLEGDSTDPTQGGHNMAGLYILDESPTTFRMIARVYDSNAVRYSSDNAISVPAGSYKFDYNWDPASRTLTARILNTDGVTVVASNNVTLPGTAQLDLDAFGLTTGFNGSFDTARNFSLFIDNVNYTAGQQWSADANGDWGTNANWDGPTPDGADHVAYFGSRITAPRTVNVESAKTVGNIFFDSAQRYTISGSNTITLDGAGEAAKVTVLSGGHTIAAPVVLNSDLVVNSAGSGVAFTGDLSASGRTITKTGAGTAQFENVRAAALDVKAGTASISQKGSNNSPGGTSVVGTLTIANSARLDLTNNSAVIDYSGPVGSLVDEVRQHLLNNRLDSSLESTARGLGYNDNAARQTPLTSFGGQSVDTDSLLIMFTRLGDANLDGTTNIGDFSLLGANFNQPGDWASGDFNYDGSTNIGDFSLLAANFNQSVGADGARSAVPEPGTLALATGLLALAARRRR